MLSFASFHFHLLLWSTSLQQQHTNKQTHIIIIFFYIAVYRWNNFTGSLTNKSLWVVLMWKWLNQWINDVPLNLFIFDVVFCCQHVFVCVMGSAAEFHFTPFIKALWTLLNVDFPLKICFCIYFFLWNLCLWKIKS